MSGALAVFDLPWLERFVLLALHVLDSRNHHRQKVRCCLAVGQFGRVAPLVHQSVYQFAVVLLHQQVQVVWQPEHVGGKVRVGLFDFHSSFVEKFLDFPFGLWPVGELYLAVVIFECLDAFHG
jgi:hypothetical protein